MTVEFPFLNPDLAPAARTKLVAAFVRPACHFSRSWNIDALMFFRDHRTLEVEMRAATLLGVTTLMIGCGLENEDANAFKVAVALPLTGTFADNGERHKLAIQMGFEDIEKQGGIRGQRIRAVLVDCGGDKATAEARVASTLGTPEQPSQPIRAIISSSTACHEATLPFALKMKVPHLEVSSGSDYDEVASYTLPMGSPVERRYELQVRALCNAEAVMTPTFLASRSDMKRVAVLRGSHPHDLMHTSTVRAELPNSAFASGGGAVVNAQDIVMPNDGPYTDAIAQAVALNADTIYFHLNGDTRNLGFFSELKRSGFQGKIVTCGMIRKPIVLDPVSPGFIDSIGNRTFFLMRGPVGSPQLTAFNTAYQMRAGRAADTFASAAYDAAILTSLGLAATQSTEGSALVDSIMSVAKGGTAVTYGETAKAMELVTAGGDVNYEGV